MERTGETIEASGQRQHRRAKSTSDQMSGVGADITTLVISVNGQVKSHQFDKVLVIGKAKLVGHVVAIIFVLLNWCDLAVFVEVAVYSGSNGGKLGDKVHRVLKCMLPVFTLLDTFCIGLCEGGFVLESSDGDGELSHGMKVRGASINELLNEFWHVRTSSPFGRQVADLLL